MPIVSFKKFIDSHKTREHKPVFAPAPEGAPNYGHEGEYGWQWSQRARIYRRAHPLCERCFKLYEAGLLPIGDVKRAEVVDHIIPKSQGGKDLFDNMQSLCYAHNNAKRFEDERKYRK